MVYRSAIRVDLIDSDIRMITADYIRGSLPEKSADLGEPDYQFDTLKVGALNDPLEARSGAIHIQATGGAKAQSFNFKGHYFIIWKDALL